MTEKDLSNLPYPPGSKQFQAALDIVKMNRELTEEDRKLLCRDHQISSGTLSNVLTALRRQKLYTDAYSRGEKFIPSRIRSINNEPRDEAILTQEARLATFENSLKETNERMNQVVETVNKLIQVFSPSQAPGESNPGDPPPAAFNAVSNPPGGKPDMPPKAGDSRWGLSDEEPPTKIPLDNASMKQIGTWVYSKNQLYYDFAKEGAFDGVLKNFDGNWSDFVNTVIEDYFRRIYGAGVGLLSRRMA